MYGLKDEMLNRKIDLFSNTCKQYFLIPGLEMEDTYKRTILNYPTIIKQETLDTYYRELISKYQKV